MENHTWIDLSEVRVDKFRQRDLGDLDVLTKSIKANGMQDPLITTRSGRLVSGWRRYKVTSQLKMNTAPVLFVADMITAIDMINKEGANPSYTKPMTWGEKVALGLILEDLDVVRREERMHRRGKVKQEKRIRKGENTIDLLAKFFGVSEQTYRRARTIYEFVSFNLITDSDLLQQAEDCLNKLGGGVSPTYYLLKGMSTTRKLDDPSAPVKKISEITSSTQQRSLIENGVTAFGGIAHGFRQVGQIHPGITAEEAIRWANDLLNYRTQISILIKKLRSHSNG
jgi:hypothetical protein